MVITVKNNTNSRIIFKKIKLTVAKFIDYFYSRKLNINKKYNKSNLEVSIVFVGAGLMKKLNSRYRRINKATDVLSFSGDNNFIGEILINYARIKIQAKKYKHTLNQELVFILIHGLLHLLGYDDKTTKGRQKMEKISNDFLKYSRI
ncbi:rRNA maturation RNase YbeY [Candidatus Falkowbacteria bacterium CG1_02_37_44]|uniref:Endoribonuclease YbeY n=2 Tax=Candidatus Falkowiibacteriota TaxID=1752728 RepID=A0A1J4T8I4_9BACT|nr:MAG: rRNA maturation RNase YbeY [Candidatus Falkowbacteria bacterium CG1_02_37_44]PIV52151.1 MAG: rRNA maturation RNase YbeY [Candidatus Falkowbacteria bacterium CG02_land_8_20_14_3_00_36_14]PIX12251.1 MAG: rRNA maturation RNase YbeY [Candidatus Falkowbacteria bacterium CG_4_8_14_3_um_filter_36_11]